MRAPPIPRIIPGTLVLLAAFALLGTSVSAEAGPGDPDPAWRVALATLAVEADGDPTARKAAETVPALLLAALLDLPEHRYSIEAARARGIRLAAASRVAADKALAEARSRLDRLAFSPSTASAERKRLEEAFRLAAETAEAASAEDTEVAVPPAKPIAFHGANASGRPIPLKTSVAELASAEKLDLVVSGSVRRIGAYLALSLEAWDRDLGAPIATIHEYSAPDDLEALVARILPVLRAVIAGEEVRRVVITTEPTDATVSIIDAGGNERLLARSERVVYLYGPSERSLVARAPGYETLTLALAGTGVDERLRLPLTAIPQGPGLVLDSVPSGAAVYLEGLKVGTTPVEVARSPFPRLAEFRLEGYRPTAFVLDPDLRELPAPGLVPETAVLPVPIETRRDAFYDALGWFVVSLPVSVLSWQVYRSYYEAALLAGEADPAYATLSVAAGASGLAFAGSAGISVALAGFSAYRLWHYIRSAD